MERNKNIDLLRCVAIFFITTWHSFLFNGYGMNGNLQELINKNVYLATFLCVLSNFLIIGVNLFFLISGYCKIKFSVKKIVSIFLQVLVIYGICSLISVFLAEQDFSLRWILDILFCVRKYWYVNVYIVLIIFSPVLNFLIDNCSEKHFKIFCFAFFVLTGGLYFIFSLPEISINNGYSIISAFGFYFIGGGLQKYKRAESFVIKNKYMFVWGGVTILIIFSQILSVFILKSARISWKLFSYNNILVMLFSVCFFDFFVNRKSYKIKTPLINFLYPAVFTIYIAQSCGFSFMKNFRAFLINFGVQNFGYLQSVLFIVPNTIIVILTLLLYHYLYNFCFSKLINILSLKIEQKVFYVYKKVSTWMFQ